MLITIVAAMSRNRVIGIENRLPWRLPMDLRRFKDLTIGKPVIMGRKTFESIGKPLPGRRNIILTHNLHFVASGCLVAHSFEEALRLAAPAEEVAIIGGAAVYQEALPLCQRIYLTIIDADFRGDAFFPKRKTSEWKERRREIFEADEVNAYRHSFLILESKARTGCARERRQAATPRLAGRWNGCLDLSEDDSMTLP